MTVELPKLRYSKEALAPHISAETLEFHYGKHHAAYGEKLNELIKDSQFADASLEDITTNAGSGPIFNNAAQHWTHSFYWHSITPNSARPQGSLAVSIKRSFGNFAALKTEFNEAAADHFGSGWTWLLLHEEAIKIKTTSDPNLSLAHREVGASGV